MAGFRDYLNRNSTAGIALAVVVFAVSLAVLIYQVRGRTGGSPGLVYFYDVNSTSSVPLDRLFSAKSDEVPPIRGPSDSPDSAPGGVRAWVFSCGDCSDRSSMFIGYLE